MKVNVAISQYRGKFDAIWQRKNFPQYFSRSKKGSTSSSTDLEQVWYWIQSRSDPSAIVHLSSGLSVLSITGFLSHIGVTVILDIRRGWFPKGGQKGGGGGGGGRWPASSGLGARSGQSVNLVCASWVKSNLYLSVTGIQGYTAYKKPLYVLTHIGKNINWSANLIYRKKKNFDNKSRIEISKPTVPNCHPNPHSTIFQIEKIESSWNTIWTTIDYFSRINWSEKKNDSHVWLAARDPQRVLVC